MNSPLVKDRAYMRAARARYLERHAGNAAAHKCLCSNVAVRLKSGAWVCARCDALEKDVDCGNTWETKPVDSLEALADRRRREVGPYDPSFYGHRMGVSDGR